MHTLPALQSRSVWHGQAHLPNAVLQRWVRHCASLAQGRAKGLGWESVPAGGAAVLGAAASTGAGCTVPSR